MRSLTDDFKPKVIAITESTDIDSIPIEELVGSLQTYELDFPRSNKQKSIALKFFDEVDSSDDELGSVDPAYLAKQFKRFRRNSRNKGRGFQKNSKTRVTQKGKNIKFEIF